MSYVARFDGWVRYRGVAAREGIDPSTLLLGSTVARDGYVELVGDDDAVLQRVTFWAGGWLEVRDGMAIAAGERIGSNRPFERRERPAALAHNAAARAAGLLAARHPRRAAVLAPIAGRVTTDGVDAGRRVRIDADDGTSWQRTLGRRLDRWWEGERVEVGDALSTGERDHHELLRLWGRDRFERHLAEELDELLYTSGVRVSPSALDLVVVEAVVDTPEGPRLRPLREFSARRSGAG